MSLFIDLKEFRHDKKSPIFFKDVALFLDKGKIHNIRGKNGTGKSTLLHIMRGDAPGAPIVDGMLKIDNKKYVMNNRRVISEVALVSQRFDMMIADQFTFEENLKFCLFGSKPALFSLLPRNRDLPGFVERFGLNKTTPVSCMSGGQRQILALMMILQKCPSILLLDEPTAALDPYNSRMVFEFLKDLSKQGLTIVVISHDHELLDEYTTGKKLEIAIDNQSQRVIKDQ